MSAKKSNTQYRRYILIFWLFVAGSIAAFYLFVALLSNGFFGSLPTFDELENPKSNLATEIYSADGVVLGKFYKENRSNVRYDNLPKHLVDALVATEDFRFYKHAGIDEKSLLRVVIKNVLLRNSGAGGGSTITQQLAKNLYDTRQYNASTIKLIFTKFKEWVTATRLERNYTKQEIITMYFNTIEYVYGAHGIKSAAKTFFNKEPDSLNIEESALLVGMVKNPVLFNPVRYEERALTRRNVVMKQMEKYGYLDQDTYDSLKTIPIDMSSFKASDHNTGLATYYREHLRQFMKDWCEANTKSDGTNYNIYKDGLKIYTTIDSRLQTYAEEAMKEWLTQLQDEFFKHWKSNKYKPWSHPEFSRLDPKFIDKAIKKTDRYRSLKNRQVPQDSIDLIFNTPIPMKVFSWHGENEEVDTLLSPFDSVAYYKMFLHAGFMAVDPENGYIRSWVGGINHKYFQYDHVNINAKRQVGSTFKPFVYTAAIEEYGFSPCHEVPNVQVTFEAGEQWGLLESWTPKNSDNEYGGMKSLKMGLAGSVNTITAYLMREIGIKPVIDLAHKMGIVSEIPFQPSICLGVSDVSVYEMTSAYTTFANNGIHTEPIFISRIEDKNGIEIASFTAKKENVLDEQINYVMLEILKNVINSGTGQRIRRDKYGGIKGEIAGKTGTTQENTDGWFMGVIPQLVTGIWVGADDPVVHFRTTALGQGANMALPITGIFLNKVYNDKTLGIDADATFKKPSSEMRIEMDCSKYKQDVSNEYDDLIMGF